MDNGERQARKMAKQLGKLAQQGAKRAQRTAMRKATRVAAKFVKAEVPVDKGILKKMQTSKVMDGKKYGIAGIVGADVAKLKEQSKADEAHGGENRPNNIDWLVNEGHVAPDGTVVPPSGYIERAEVKGYSAVDAAYVAALAAAIDKEVQRS